MNTIEKAHAHYMKSHQVTMEAFKRDPEAVFATVAKKDGPVCITVGGEWKFVVQHFDDFEQDSAKSIDAQRAAGTLDPEVATLFEAMPRGA